MKLINYVVAALGAVTAATSAQAAAWDLRMVQYDASNRSREVVIAPAANSLLGFGADKRVVNITAGANITISGNQISASGSGTGNVIQGATFAAGQLVYVSNATTGEITGIPGATYNSGNNTISFNGTLSTTGALTPSAVSGATANGQFLIGNVTSGNFEKATITQGAGVTLTPTPGGLEIAANASGTNTGDQNIIFGFAVSGQDTITANSTATLLNVAGAGGITVTTNNTTKTVTIDGSAIAGGNASFTAGMTMFIPDADSPPSGWALTGANGIPAFTTPDADYKAVIKMAGTVETPSFSPVAGAIPTGTTVNFSSGTSGVTFMATTNGTDPSRSVGSAGASMVVSSNTTIEVMAYKDAAYLIDSAVASAAYTIDPVPIVTAAAIDGNALVLTYSEAVSRGGSYSNAHFDLDMSTTGSNIAVTYVSGDGTTTHTYTAASAAVNGETVDLDFSGAANSIEETAGYNQDLAAITSAAVTNSTAGGGSPTFYYVEGFNSGNGGSGTENPMSPTQAKGGKITLPTGTITKYSIYVRFRNFATDIKFSLHDTGTFAAISGTDHSASVGTGDGQWHDFTTSKSVTGGTYYVDAIISATEGAISTSYITGAAGDGIFDGSATYAGFPTLVSPTATNTPAAIRIEVTP